MNLKKFWRENMGWVQIAHGRNQFQAILKTVMTLQV
jgi:hypothetical protein